jgi:hypothetical protein
MEQDTVTLFEAFGCAVHECASAKTREVPRDAIWPPDELTGDIGHIQIVPFRSMADNMVRLELHGDDPNDAFVYVGGIDERAVKEKWFVVRDATRRLLKEVWS